jgi:hypothetical protein
MLTEKTSPSKSAAEALVSYVKVKEAEVLIPRNMTAALGVKWQIVSGRYSTDGIINCTVVLACTMSRIKLPALLIWKRVPNGRIDRELHGPMYLHGLGKCWLYICRVDMDTFSRTSFLSISRRKMSCQHKGLEWRLTSYLQDSPLAFQCWTRCQQALQAIHPAAMHHMAPKCTARCKI